MLYCVLGRMFYVILNMNLRNPDQLGLSNKFLWITSRSRFLRCFGEKNVLIAGLDVHVRLVTVKKRNTVKYRVYVK